MNRDTRDALLVSAFFLGYAFVLVILQRIPTPKSPLDMNRLTFLRTQRDRLISEENNTVGITDGD